MAAETHEEKKLNKFRAQTSASKNFICSEGKIHWIADIIPASRIHYPVIFARLFGAIVCGGLIGFEREVRDCPASCRARMSLMSA
ncbi:hypothetical protein HFO98_13310 [Rhizobium leguminosarum]|nr:hypothetical protein [Rhizobium leguminosarum]MBY5409419.1 hypothetical protein [Rhizobium leguminosarum]